MRCPKCRKELREGAKFCPSCGTRVSNRKRNRGFRLFIIIILILSAILGGTGIGILAAKIVGSSNSAPEIHNAEEAIAYAEELGADLGYKNAMSELTEKVTTEFEGDCYYRLQQNYRGIPVYGKTVVYAVDGNGKINAILGNVEDIKEEFSLVPTVTSDQVISSIKTYLTDVFEMEDVDTVEIHELTNDNLCVYIDKNSQSASLAYKIDVGFYEFLVSATNPASILSATNLFRSSATVTNDLRGQLREYKNVKYEKKDGRFYLIDEEKKVETYQINNSLVWTPSIYSLFNTKNVYRNSELLNWKDGKKPEEAAVDAYVNTRIAYDYFSTVLKNCSTDGNGNATIKIHVGAEWSVDEKGEYVSMQNNAFSSTTYEKGTPVTELWFNSKKLGNISIATYLDVVGHEYTHSVEYLHSGMIYSGEAGAIMEALSDIFGDLIEAWFEKQEPDWIHCGGEGRNIKSPEASSNPQFYQGANWVDPTDTSSDNDNGGVHKNSTVISHAAYLMWNGIDGTSEAKELSENELAELWYRAMLMMPSDCTFAECRFLVELAASSMNLTDMQVQCIGEAFDAVGIRGEEDILVDYQVKPGCELSVLGTDGSAYDNYTVSISGSGIYTYYQKNSPALYYGLSDYHTNSVVTNTDPFTLPTQEGAYTITISDNENPASSVSFVIGVSRENTKVTLQIFTEFQKPLVVTIKDPNLIPSIYAKEDNPFDFLSIDSVNNTKVAFSVLWYKIFGMSKATCELSGNTGSFRYVSDNPGETVAGCLSVYDEIIKLTVEETTFDLLDKTDYYYQFVGDRFPKEKLEEIKASLEVPDSLDIVVDYGAPSYSDTEHSYLIRVDVRQNDKSIASATVDYFTGEIISDIIKYSEAGYDASNLVSDAYSDCVPQNLYNLEAYFHIPKVNANLPEIEETNTKIYDDYYEYMQKHVYGPIEAGSNTPIGEISYIWEVKDQYLSILMYVMWAAKPSCEVYTISLETGALVENSELLTAYGISEEGFNELVAQASQKLGDNLWQPVPYVNPGTKDLCAVGSSEKWGYDKLVNLTGTTEPFCPWETPAPERVADALVSETVVASGSCGNNLTWTLSSDGTLKISGSGEMTNYYEGDDPPQWLDADVSVTSVIFDGDITSIGQHAFCFTSIKNISIPASVTDIGYSALNYIDTLEGIWVEKGNPVFSNDDSGVLFNKEKTTLITAPAKLSNTYTVPATVTWIYDAAFSDCTGISNIVLPDSVSQIGQGAFSGCSGLGSISLPQSVTEIDYYTFYGCTSMTDIHIPAEICSVGWGAFGECPLQNVYYGGTKQQWERLMENCEDDNLSSAMVYELSY